MRKKRSTGGVAVNAIAGTHVVTLGLDLTDAARKGCLGFAIQREDHTEDERYWMSGMKTFAETDPGLGPGGQISSREHPFQAFQWADYSAKPDHDYTYTAIPLYGKPAKLKEGPRASVRVTTEAEFGKPHSVFFNRGSIASQEYARRFQNTKPSALKPPERRDAAYRWLSRGLSEALLAFLARAKDGDYALRAAMYEFKWPTVLEAFGAAKQRGADVHICFDGIKASPGDDNRDAIDRAGIGAICTPRTTGTPMHNKFVVLLRKGKPVSVWTGSTNITENGIFGHANVGHIVEDAAVAREYFDYWTELSAVPSPENKDEKDWVVANNPRPPKPWDRPLTTVFSPHRGKGVFDWYATIAGEARGALLMTFAFGMDERFQKVYEQDDDVLKIAVMDKEGNGSALEKGKKDVARIRRRANVLIAVGNRIVTNSFDRWLAEHSGLSTNVRWVHTKFMLRDPLSKDPVIVTGSANFSPNSTDVNNENMLVIRGDTRAADIYLGEYMRLYSHYALREAVKIALERGDTDFVPSHLAPDASWQAEYYEPGNDREMRRRYFAGTG